MPVLIVLTKKKYNNVKNNSPKSDNFFKNQFEWESCTSWKQMI